MNKILHGLVYVFLLLAAAGLYFEVELNRKRTELTDRNRMQENYFIRIAKTVEKGEPAKDASFEIKKDASPVEARLEDSPDMDNLLEDYPASLEQANLETYNWDNPSDRHQLRSVYVLDAEGKPQMDAGEFLKTGPGTEDEILNRLYESTKNQLTRLNATRQALTDLRGKLESVVNELNKLKPEARQDKVTIVEKNEKIATLEGEKTELENQVTKQKSQIDELNTEITSLKDEVTAAQDETAAVKEDLEAKKKIIEQLKQMIRSSVQPRGERITGGPTVTALPFGDKGKIISADNENMFVIVEFSDEAMKQMKGEDGNSPLPLLEFGVRRSGFKGPAGEFVGRIRLRQEVKGKNYVTCDILGAWEQDKLKANDVIFAD